MVAAPRTRRAPAVETIAPGVLKAAVTNRIGSDPLDPELDAALSNDSGRRSVCPSSGIVPSIDRGSWPARTWSISWPLTSRAADR
jgi:hypothetical protein